jgi:CRP-like cAMP-binding protein
MLAAYRLEDQLVAERLRGVALLASLPDMPTGCLHLLRLGEFFAVPARTLVAQVGQAASLLIVTHGQLAIDPDGRPCLPGGYSGAAEALTGQAFSHAVRSTLPTTFYRLGAQPLNRLLDQCPGIARQLLLDFAHQCLCLPRQGAPDPPPHPRKSP